jgi:hypothetical protein
MHFFNALRTALALAALTISVHPLIGHDGGGGCRVIRRRQLQPLDGNTQSSPSLSTSDG